MTSPDIRKSLPVLREEWEGCTACDLGVRREAVNGSFVFGEGILGGIMFIGEGPGSEEEELGRPFADRSGELLRHTIERLGLSNCSYITNVVSCRSCAQAYDNEGQPRYRKNYRTKIMEPVINDQPPTPAQMAACLPRLHEEIYLVDPVLIVTLGGAAAQALLNRAVSIQSEAGSAVTVKVPGAGRVPVLTEKKQQWLRKVRGQLVMPTKQSEVEYLALPLMHPSFVLRNSKDARWKNPVQLFAEGMRTAATLYNRYMYEVYGERRPQQELSIEEMQEVTSG